MLSCKIGIIGNRKKPLAKKTAKRAIALLQRERIRFSVDSGFLKTKRSSPLKKIKAGLFLVFGGDGTMLYACRELKKQVPLLGVNCGQHGHLMRVRPRNIGKAIEKLLNGKFSIEKRSRLDIVADGRRAPSVLNEVIVAPEESFRLAEFKLMIETNVSAISADAVAIATPTGSTAFAFSAGGKKIPVSKKIFEVLPVHAFGGPKKAFFVSDSSRISVFPLHKQIACEAIIDGQVRVPVKKSVVVKKSSAPALFVRLL